MTQSSGHAATIYTVAERAGVSTATVSRALAGSPKVAERTRAAVVQAAQDLDYLPDAAARALAGRRTHALGLVLPDVDGPFYAELLVGFEIAASRLGFSVVIMQADPRHDARRAIRRLAGTVDAIAFMARSAASDALVAEVAGRRPVITVARAQVPGRDALFAENRETARRLTEHLLAGGRRRPGFVGTPERGSDIGERHRGFVDALTAAGIAVPEVVEAEPTEEAGAAAAERLLADGLPYDALVCGNDEIAIALLQTLQDRGVRIPQDLAITGWDDITTARYIRPALTTVAQPVRGLGALAAERLAALIDGAAPEPAPVVLPSEIVLRSSCGGTPDPTEKSHLTSTKELS